jgi:hypothetical protein
MYLLESNEKTNINDEQGRKRKEEILPSYFEAQFQNLSGQPG